MAAPSRLEARQGRVSAAGRRYRGAAARLKEFADGQLVHHDPGGQLPVVDRCRMRDSLLQASRSLVPAGGLPVQAGRTVGGFQRSFRRSTSASKGW